MNEFANLDELFEAMRENDPRTLDRHEQWSSNLPTFGGADMDDLGVWSWDETRMICGTCGDDLKILPRAADPLGYRRAAATLGRRGGQSTSAAKRHAARENGKKGGRPHKHQ